MVTALVLFVAGSALALGGLQLSVKTAKKADGPYAAITPIKVPDEEAKSAYVKVKSKAEKPVGATLSEERVAFSGPEYATDWFKGKKKITADLHDDGYDFTAKPGKTKRFRVRIKAPEGAEGLCLAAATDIGGTADAAGYIAVNQSDICNS
jgi:hypothetical protein